MAQINQSALVLAGGRSRRFGSNKALAPWKSRTMIEQVIQPLTQTFKKVYIISRDPDIFEFLRSPDIIMAPDLFEDHHSLGGIYSGLFHCDDDFAFVTACDMPFILPDLIHMLWQRHHGFDAVIPEWNQSLQPLCGFYSSRLLPQIGQAIDHKQFKLIKFLESQRVNFVNSQEIKKIDQKGQSFQDIDSPRDYQMYAPLQHSASSFSQE